ncbi:TerD family protein [Streptomyces sp. NPDC020807]|uniref:TerD family protein n=1 Tax=Streptomyces sp. NPDC020807 TaxID=3155119 RepID=UPI0033E64FFF
MGHTNESSWVPSVTLLVGIGRTGTAALLVGADGRVRGDADMVFEGRPVHPSGAVRHKESGVLSLALHEVEPEVERIVIAGPAGPGSLAAMAPDREVVVAWLIAAPEDAEAVVFGEFFRESGGWKFTGIGEGYASGLAELVTAYGVGGGGSAKSGAEAGAGTEAPSQALARSPWRVLSAQAAPARPAPEAGGPPAPATQPAPAPVAPPVPTAQPAPVAPPFPAGLPHASRPYELVAGWEFGPVFEPFTATGEGERVVRTDGRVPPGPVLVEAAREGGGYFGVFSLAKFGRDDDIIANTTLQDFAGSSVVRAPGDRPLQLRVDARVGNRWALRVSPVAAARHLTGTLSGRGPEALLYTGGAADLRVQVEADEKGRGYVSMAYHEVAGRTTLLTHPAVAVSGTGPLAHTVPIPAGPLLMLFETDAPWTLTVREID